MSGIPEYEKKGNFELYSVSTRDFAILLPLLVSV